LLSNWISLFPFQMTKQGYLLALWKSIPKFILWKIWIERNNLRETKRTQEQIVSKIKALFSESIPYFVKAPNNNPLSKDEEEWLRHLGIQAPSSPCPCIPPKCSWEIRMGKQYLEVWKLSKNLNFFSFDRASKGNLGVAGGGGVISNKDGTNILRFAWGLGVSPNNREKSLHSGKGSTKPYSSISKIW
jgi:hypothetical protein